MCKLQTQSTLALASDSQRKQSIKLDKKDVEIVYSIMYSPGLPNGLKGLQPRAPKADGPQSQDNKSAHDDVKKCASKLVTTYPADIGESFVSEFLKFIAVIIARHGDQRRTYEWTVEGTWRILLSTFLNVGIALRLYLTLPVTNFHQKSFSTLARIKNHLRASMGHGQAECVVADVHRVKYPRNYQIFLTNNFIHTEFDRRNAMQCFICAQCIVIVDFRVGACSLFRSTPVEKFVLFSTKLALQNKHFSAQNALTLTYRHLGFQKFSRGETPRPPLKGKEEGRGR